MDGVDRTAAEISQTIPQLDRARLMSNDLPVPFVSSVHTFS